MATSPSSVEPAGESEKAVGLDKSKSRLEKAAKFRCCCFPWLWNWIRECFCFSKAAMFISALAFADAFVDKTFTQFLITYVDDLRNRESLRTDAIIVNIFHGVISFKSIVISWIDMYRLGSFSSLAITTPAMISGLLLFYILERQLRTRIRLFYPALLFFALGQAGLNASSRPFLDRQFADRPLPSQTEEERRTTERRGAIWFYAFSFLGAIISSTFTSGIDWESTFITSSVVVAVAYLFFCCGKRFYKPTEPITDFCSSLKKAKPLLRLLPLWSVFIAYSLVAAAGDTFFIEQIYGLNDQVNISIPLYGQKGARIPLIAFYLLQSFTKYAFSLAFDILTDKLQGDTIKQRVRFLRVGIGMFFASGCCMMAWWVEVRRLGFTDKEIAQPSATAIAPSPAAVVDMTILWLAPQFFLLGIVEGLVEKGQEDLFYDLVSENLHDNEYAYNESMLGTGRFVAAFSVLIGRWLSWVEVTLDDSRLDNYFAMLAIVSAAALILYSFLAYKYDWNITRVESQATREEGEELPVIKSNSELVVKNAPADSASKATSDDIEGHPQHSTTHRSSAHQ